MWRKEFSDFVIIEGKAGGSESLRVRAQINLAADDACLEVRYAITPIAKGFQDSLQSRKKENRNARIGGKILVQA
jgi:hypothetical protein